MRNPARKWTKEEDALLIELRATMTLKDIAPILNRSRGALRGHCTKLGLTDKMATPWTEEQLLVLRNWYVERDGKKFCIADLAEKIGKDKANVCRKARQLGLTNRKRKSVAPRPVKIIKPKVVKPVPKKRILLRESLRCLQCEKVFLAPTCNKRKFCSLRCAYADPERARGRKVVDHGCRPCAQCGEQYRVTSLNKRSKFCSPKCAVDSKTREKLVRQCPICNEKFLTVQKQIKKYCSPKCRWSDENERQRRSDVSMKTMMLRQKDECATPNWSNRKGGKREDLNNVYFRSAWEANIARYLNFLQSQKKIARWEFEPDTFVFEQIKRGVRSYCPDFKIWDTEDGEPYYWEVKGYDHPRGITARNRLAKYYPKVNLFLIDAPAYRKIARTFGKACNFE